MSDPITDAPRVRAPELPAGLDWIDAATAAAAPRTLAELRGRIVLLDFWRWRTLYAICRIS